MITMSLRVFGKQSPDIRGDTGTARSLTPSRRGQVQCRCYFATYARNDCMFKEKSNATI